MHKLLLSIVFVIFTCSVFAQEADVVKWSSEAKKTGVNEYELIFTAKIDKGWHLYSQDIGDGGPVPTTFIFNEGKYALNGKVEEIGNAEKIFDKGFEMNVIYYSGEVKFVQKIKLTGPQQQITGTYEFMVCDDEMCLPPKTENFSFNVKYEKP